MELKLSMKDNSSLFINLRFHYTILEYSCFDSANYEGISKKKNRSRNIEMLHHNVGNQNYIDAQFSKVKVNTYSLSKWSNYPIFIFLCPKIESKQYP